MTAKDYFDLGKDAITAAAAATAAVVAVLGLTAWKKQLKGRAEHDAARKLFKAILQLRDAISFVRNPWIPIGETTQAIKEAKKENPEAEVDSNRAVYHLRWNKIVEALSAVELESLETEIFWGEEIKNNILPLRRCVGRLNAAVGQMLNPELRTTRADCEEIIYEISGNGKKDEFTKEVEAGVQQVADFLRPKIKFE